MANGYSSEDLLGFLAHAADRGLIPAATSQALAVACRNIFEVMDDQERADLRKVDLEKATQRFITKRAKDFSPSSLKEYRTRLKRAVALFFKWREDPANFSVKTRATKRSGKRNRAHDSGGGTVPSGPDAEQDTDASAQGGGYETSLPIRPGVVVTIKNLPKDLTAKEAEHFAEFIRFLSAG